jgi:hypothetical protein
LFLCSAGCSAGIQNDGVFRFGKNVPASERDPIKSGVKAMQDWIAANGNVHLKRFTVQVDDNINTLVSQYAAETRDSDPLITAQWLVSGGAITSGEHIYVYVGPEWRDYPDWVKSSIAAHETFHVAQFGYLYDDWFLAGLKPVARPPDWVIEGGADYAAARALDAAGIHGYSEVSLQTREQAQSYTRSLASISSAGTEHAAGGAAPYAVGFLAMEELAHGATEGAMFEFWDRLTEDGSWEAAFTTVYGEHPTDFVRTFDEARATDPATPAGGIAGHLVRESNEPVAGASIRACPLAPHSPTDCRGTWTAEDGTFELALPTGEWMVLYYVSNRKSVEQGSFERDGTSLPTVRVEDSLIDGLAATVTHPF